MCPGVPTRVGVVQWSGPDGAAPSPSAMRTRLARGSQPEGAHHTVGEFCPWTATIVKERYMVKYNLDTEHSIPHVQPKSAIENDDFV